jgi:hypothetical protein
MYVNAKMIHVETVLGIWKGRIKDCHGVGKFKDNMFDTL